MKLAEYQDCTGCGLCAAVCRTGAIEMKPGSSDGFFYPIVNDEQCVQCGKCSAYCPILNNKAESPSHLVGAYAAAAKEDTIRLASTSGGIFFLLAKEVILKGGAVAGAVYTQTNDVVHQLAWDEEGLNALMRSKYLQSKAWVVYSEVLMALQDGKEVLFCGTPCQADAVRHIAEAAGFRGSLLLVDLFCRGVPSPKAFHKYLSDLETETGKKIKGVAFKDKELGWHSLGTRYTFTDGSELLEEKDQNNFLRSFVEWDYCVRESCFHCPYKCRDRVSDISLGDFWGTSELDLEDDKGISAVLVNSEKGAVYFEGILSQLHWKRTTADKIIAGNRLAFQQLRNTPKKRKKFWDLLEQYPYRIAHQMVQKDEI